MPDAGFMILGLLDPLLASLGLLHPPQVRLPLEEEPQEDASDGAAAVREEVDTSGGAGREVAEDLHGEEDVAEDVAVEVPGVVGLAGFTAPHESS